MSQGAFVYILSGSFKHLYVGVTTDLTHRIAQHKHGVFPTALPAVTASTNLSM